MRNKDYYKVLGVDKNATQDEIKSAYRKLAKKYHPDANPENKKYEKSFLEINEANETLGDPEKRKRYDTMGSESAFRQNSRYNSRSDNGSRRNPFHSMFFGGDEFDNIFNGSSSPKKGEDIDASIELTIEEGFKGIEKRISLKFGGGEKDFTFKVPLGVKEGQKIRFKGQGEAGINGGSNGDLYLVVKFSLKSKFIIEGIDLHTTIDIMPWEAALGAKISVDTIDGEILMTIPSGMQAGSKLRASKKGYIDKNGNRGNLYITLRIVNPKVITPQIKELYEKLSELK
jgi:curved DNA-binding protein